MRQSSDRRAASIAAGWTYFHSAALGMECSCRPTPHGVELWTADKTYYTPSELAIIKETTGEITKELHTIKRMFDGEVVSRE